MAKRDDPGAMLEDVAAIEEAAGWAHDAEDTFVAPKVDEPTKPRFRGRSHLDMVRWLIERHGKDLRFVSDRENGHKTSESWAVWDPAQGIWLIGPAAASQVSEWINEMADDLRTDFQDWIQELLGDVFDQSFQEATSLNNEIEHHKKILAKDFPELWAYWGFCKQMRDYNFTAALMNKLKLAKEIQIGLQEFDRNIYLLTVMGGLTIDLRTGEMYGAMREDFITRRVEIRYDPAAVCPKFYEYLNYAQPDEEMRVFLMRIAGLCLTGNVNDQAIFFIYGAPMTGKNVFTSVLKSLSGPYAATIRIDALAASRYGHSGPDDSIADLHHARIAIADEPDEDVTLSAARMKELAGGTGAEIYVNPKHRRGFKMTPEYKILITTNHKPKMKDTSDAIFRRVHVVGFDRKVLVPNINLVNELMQELSGILNWAIAGARAWVAQGLCPPDKVRVATDEYRQESDEVGVFLTTYFDLAPSADITFKEVWDLYQGHCRELRLQPMTKTALGLQLDRPRTVNNVTVDGFPKTKVGGHSWRKGLAIKDEYRTTPGHEFDGY